MIPDVPAPPRAPRLLDDPWERRGPIPLDGPLERADHTGGRAVFWRLFQAFAVLTLAFVLFQAISSVVLVLMLMASGVPRDQLVQEMASNLGAHARAVMVANTVGQVIGLAVPAALLTRLHSSRPAAFLRWRPGDGRLVGLSVLGLFALTPVVMWLGHLNSSLPLPQWVKVLEEMQMQFIEQVLEGDTVGFNLVALALTPAFCEELLFRGYVQRQAGRGLGAAGGILVSGIVFGLYHLRLSQVLPLSVLGLYLAYLVWRTGSLWPAIVVHFANNAFAVLSEAYLTARPELQLDEIDQLDIPWFYVVAGAAGFVVIVAAMHRVARSLLERAAVPPPYARENPSGYE